MELNSKDNLILIDVLWILNDSAPFETVFSLVADYCETPDGGVWQPTGGGEPGSAYRGTGGERLPKAQPWRGPGQRPGRDCQGPSRSDVW